MQDELYFKTCTYNGKIKLFVNSKEQIFVEKIIPILKFGLLTTRYKDFFDIYWLIKDGNLNKNKIDTILDEKIFNHKINNIDSKSDILELFKILFQNENFMITLFNRKNNWINISRGELIKTIIDYFESLIKISV